MTQQAAASTADAVDGRHDFDFLFGTWRIANRKLEDPLAGEASKWLEFDATVEVEPILGGLGNCDHYSAPDFPGRSGYRGFGLRLFEVETGLWRIWWASTTGRGRLDTPVVGRFRDGEGRFECDDLLDGRELKVRFDWTGITPSSARWEQSFSFDGGRSFEPNWIMELTRVAGGTACGGQLKGRNVDEKVNLAAKLALFQERWSPKVVARLNDHDVILVQVKGEFVWHKHDETDDFFLVLDGHLTIQLRDRDVELDPGELFVVPRGVEHCPRADEETHVLLIEPVGTLNTGDAGGPLTAEREWI